MVAEIEDSNGDTGIGAEHMVIETQRDSTTGTAQYSVADEVVTLVEETVITAGVAEQFSINEKGERYIKRRVTHD